MDNITIGQIAGAIGSLTVIIGAIASIIHFVKKSTTDKIDKNTADIKSLKAEVEYLKREISDDKEERIILLQGLLACLKGLQEQGCDGAVTTSITEIEQYLLKKAHV